MTSKTEWTGKRREFSWNRKTLWEKEKAGGHVSCLQTFTLIARVRHATRTLHGNQLLTNIRHIFDQNLNISSPTIFPGHLSVCYFFFPSPAIKSNWWWEWRWYLLKGLNKHWIWICQNVEMGITHSQRVWSKLISTAIAPREKLPKIDSFHSAHSIQTGKSRFIAKHACRKHWNVNWEIHRQWVKRKKASYRRGSTPQCVLCTAVC